MKRNEKPINDSLNFDELLTLLQQLREQQHSLQQQLRSEQTNLQQLAKRLWLQQEHDRARFARDLHDDLGQQLTGIATQLAAAGDNPLCRELHQQVKHAIASTRTLARLMHPTLVHDLGLQAGIQWLNRQLLQPAGITLELDYGLSSRLDTDAELFLFRIVQEAMVNTVNYAQADRFELLLERSQSALLLIARDNGQGFDSQQVEAGVGLQGMQDRASAFGAEFTLRSAPGKGCEIQIQLPLHQAITPEEP
ncbi:sensor histidine kinase [Pseudidiomarina sp. 1ASP75-14]|uniref:sensor histidine kinase n=1 Tax=Pseudidiomarina terrestris TaxID=2820060 RepID=UPI00264E98BC|nr:MULTISPECIES: sensor histidine kinase [unclassified Pseudidiomarina]MDN7127907.1 sensor histidine kinase [Pseudidiomarina sp. 1APR75-33.1]MDN7137395.1 sensor histidine kinase [Pseudidiomarina sp. 1ASP75-14]